MQPGNEVAGRRDEATVDTTTSPGSIALPAPRTAPDASRATAPPVVPAPRAAPTPVAPVAVPTRRRPGWPELVVAAVAYVGLLIVLHAVLDGAGLRVGPWLAGASALAAAGAVAAALAVRVRSTAPLCLRAAPLAMLPAGVALGLATWLLARGLVALWSDLGGTLPPAQPGLWTFTGTTSTVAVVVLVGLVVPLVEELLFRGVVVAALGRYGVVAAVGGSAVLFGAAHGLTFVVVAAVVLGAVNAVMVWRLRSIWPGVVAHATFNLVSIVMTLALS